MINSIYTNREIFLRELISNSSDAVDKLYFMSLVDDNVKINRADLAITVGFDETERSVTVSDNGIGMSKDDLDKNLGTIAHSDSYEFKTARAGEAGSKDANHEGTDAIKGEGTDAVSGANPESGSGTADKAQAASSEADGYRELEESALPKDVDIIGQFGVGFYSAFMVGKKVRVVSRAYGSDEAWAWESNGVDGYEIKPAERAEHGTDVIVYLKDNTAEEGYDHFASEYGLQDLIKRYSSYVRYPIKMEVTKTRQVPAPEDAGDDYRPEYESYTEVETVNSMIPIWKRRASEVSDEEYNEFYKTDFHDYEDPLRTMSLHAEGTLTYDALMFIPAHAPYDM